MERPETVRNHAGVTWAQVPGSLDRNRGAYHVTVAFAAVAAVAVLVDTTLGLVAAVALAVMAAVDWRLSSAALIAMFAGVVLLVPADLHFGTGPVDISVDRIALGVLLAGFVTGFMTRAARPLMPDVRRVSTPLFWLLAIAAMSLALNVAGGGLAVSSGTKALLLLAANVAIYVIILAVVEPDDVLPIVKAIIAIGGFVGFTALLERFTVLNLIRGILGSFPMVQMRDMTELTRGEGLRVAGTAEHPIALGGLMAMLLPLALYVAFTAREKRGRWMFAVACIGASMLLSVSRSALLAGAVGFAVLFWYWPKHRKVLATMAIVGMLGVHMLFPGVLGAFRATLSPEYIQQQESMENPYNRVSDYPKVREIVPRRPLLGMGYNAFDPETYFFLDNQFLKLLIELGIAGTWAAVLFVWRLAGSLRAAIRRLPDDRGLEAALLGSVLSFAFLSFFFDTLSFAQITWMFFVLAALSVRLTSTLEPAVARLERRPATEARLATQGVTR